MDNRRGRGRGRRNYARPRGRGNHMPFGGAVGGQRVNQDAGGWNIDVDGVNVGNAGNRQHGDRQNNRVRRGNVPNNPQANPNNQNNDGGQNNNNNTRRRQYPLTYKQLEQLYQNEEPPTIILKLVDKNRGLENILCDSSIGNNKGMIVILLRVLGKICQSNDLPEAFRTILQIIEQEAFLNHINQFLLQTQFETGHKAGIPENITNVLRLLRSNMIHMPGATHKSCKIALSIITGMIERDELESLIPINLLNEVTEMIDDQDKKVIHKPPVRNLNAYFDELHLQEAPSDFRDIPVFPDMDDIKDKRDVFIRSNLIDKAYRSQQHYLDVQFRLLREDFVRPLRKGIANVVMQEGTGDNKKFFSDDIKVYTDVKITFPICSLKGVFYKIHFSTEFLQNVRWQNTKRLLFGNFLCLSKDFFKTDAIFAVVADRKPEDLEMGYVTVNFVRRDARDGGLNLNLDDDDDFEVANPSVLDTSATYIMIETDSYFEAYRHVLSGLQNIRDGELPLSRYLVFCENEMERPNYLRGTHIILYDMKSVAPNSHKVNVSANSEWPTDEELSLDASQSAALRLALTHELAIIQGPPGTGKTHVGLAIMKVLLNNMHAWKSSVDEPVRRALMRGLPRQQQRQGSGPIVLVCYTNHALDQFLEGISTFWKKDSAIVRVGGRCKKESLKQYTLIELKKKQRTLGKIDGRNQAGREQRAAVWNLKNEIQEMSEGMNINTNKLEAATKCILQLEILKEFIPIELLVQIKEAEGWFNVSKTNKNFALLYWLGLEFVKASPDDLRSQGLEQRDIQLLRATGMNFTEIKDGMLQTQSINAVDILQWAELKGLRHVINIADLIRFGVPYEIIILAIKKSGLKEPNRLAVWIDENHHELMQDEDFQQVLHDDENKEEADLIQDERYLDTDYVGIGRLQKNKDGKNLLKQDLTDIAALTFQDISAASNKEEENADGFQLSSQDKKKQKQKIKKELGKTKAMSTQEEYQIHDIWTLKLEDKWKLYRLWVQRWQQTLMSNVDLQTAKYEQLCQRLEEVRSLDDESIIKKADVVALTTTGAARLRHIINKLDSKIVIVEEAAECLEAHIVTAMPRSTQHLILIGDHQQLKPSPTVYDLAQQYNLDTSLFERMVGTIPHQTLQIQHRMRPAIADLLRPHIYKVLLDADNVKKYKEIKGVQSSLYFITHNEHEESISDGRSKQNQHEAEFLVALCKHLLLQGYKPTQITILTAYTGQLIVIKKVMRSNLVQGVHVTAVDNFQGEESDIILLSLVRSNEKGNIGFLKTENRICVALSRAKMGLFCIGNIELLCEKSSMWRKIANTLRKNKCYGTSLPLRCVNHPNKVTEVTVAKDFKNAPEGGCNLACTARLDCGHSCSRICHPDDHSDYKCRKKCGEKCSAGIHTCTKLCYICKGNCVDHCLAKVTKRIPLCQHEQKVPCFQDPNSYSCKERCSKLLNCGHQCQNYCSSTTCSTTCSETIAVKLECGHKGNIKCYQKDMQLSSVKCKAKCSHQLQCGHTCQGNCYDCMQGRLHQFCKQKCSRTLVCGHTCKSPCSENCPPCQQKCNTACEHNKCQNKCGIPCVLCKESCGWKCKHFKCSVTCSEPCNRPACNKPCPKKLKCEHNCIGLCGEKCPKLCRICNKDDVTEIFFGDEDEDDARFVELQCGHIFTYTSLDHWMNQSNDGHVEFRSCPRCKTPITNVRRYGNQINEFIRKVNKVKEKTVGTIKESKKNTKELLKLLNTISEKRVLVNIHFDKELSSLIEQLKKGKLSNNELLLVESQFEMLLSLSKVTKQKDTIATKLKNTDIQELDWRKFETQISTLENDLFRVKNWVMIQRHSFTDEENISFEHMTEYFGAALKYFALAKKAQDEMMFSVTSKYFKAIAKHLFEDYKVFIGDKKYSVTKYLNKLENLIGMIPDMGITKRERDMILKAMNLNKGHWYECPNGHVYCITECGGAMETARCPVEGCGAVIGGSQHALDDSNRVATRMDGATRSAWDAQNHHIPPEAFI